MNRRSGYWILPCQEFDYRFFLTNYKLNFLSVFHFSSKKYFTWHFLIYLNLLMLFQFYIFLFQLWTFSLINIRQCLKFFENRLLVESIFWNFYDDKPSLGSYDPLKTRNMFLVSNFSISRIRSFRHFLELVDGFRKSLPEEESRTLDPIQLRKIVQEICNRWSFLVLGSVIDFYC